MSVHELARARSEVDVAADVLAELFVSKLLRDLSQDGMREAARHVGIPIDALRDAILERRYRDYKPPAGKPTRAPIDMNPAHVARAAKTAAVRRSKIERDTPGGTERRCKECKEWLPVDQFDVKRKRTGGRWHLCNDCRRDYQRQRYLTVKKLAGLSAAGLAFTWTEEDGDQLVCTLCHETLVAGDEVIAVGTVRHAKCQEAEHG